MFSLKAILHPTDFSSTSQAALDVARTLARDHGARLVLLHVVPIDASAYGGFYVPPDLAPFRDELKAIQARVEGRDLRAPVESRLVQGDVVAEILQVAEETDADLMVVGSHGRSAVARLLMGSVAEAVLRRARCPVLIVKALTAPAAADGHRHAAAIPLP